MFHNIDVIEDINNIPLNFDKPYVLKNNKMVAVKKWNLDYLKNKLSNETVRTQYHKTIEEFQKESDNIIYKKFSEYISDIENGKLYYLADYDMRFFENILDKNDTLEKFKFRRQNIKKYLYLGINTYSNCHIHLVDDVVLNQIFGKKIVYMYDYYDNPSLELISIFNNKFNFIKANFWTLDLSKYKLYKVVLEPGDCLLIPPWWYHAVKGLDLSCSVSIFYKRTDLNYMKMGDIKIRVLFQNIEFINITILYIIIYCILLYFQYF